MCPTFCPKSAPPAIDSEPKANQRKTHVSNTVPTVFDTTTDRYKCPRNRIGVYTSRSLTSENRNAAPDAKASCGGWHPYRR